MKYYRYLAIRYYISKVNKGTVLASLFVLLLILAMLYVTIKYPMTGKVTMHEAEIVGASITHGYTGMGQSLRVKLDGGEVMTISHSGNILKEGQLITIIELHRKHGRNSNYVIK